MLSTRPLVGEGRVAGVQRAGTLGIYSRAARPHSQSFVV